MKIFGVGRNYVAHAEELKNEIPETPVIFTKPDTALLKNNAPFYYPQFSKEVDHEVEIIVRIGKEGKNIQEKFAHKYYQEIGLGIDFTARDIQRTQKAKGLPWDMAKGFDGSAPISNWVSKEEFKDIQNIPFALHINGSIKQEGRTNKMIFPIDRLIAYISVFFTLKHGDIIFTGTPAGVGQVQIGDHLEGFLENTKMLDLKIL